MQQQPGITSSGFAPVVNRDANILILGSLPGKRSLEAAQYYAHPQNVFWKVMNSLFGIEGNYEQRCARLAACGIALWDVLRSSDRPGSMDADIRMSTAKANDFSRFFSDYPRIRRVCFNGRKAEDLYRKMVLPALNDSPGMYGLPSTSPAYASMPFEKKLDAWRRVLDLNHNSES